MSRVTPGTTARAAGFTVLGNQQFFRSVPSLYDGKPVGLILHIVRSRAPGQFQFSLSTDGGKTVVYGTGIAGDIETAVQTALIMHEVHEFRKEADRYDALDSGGT